jgi:hypothetical protein
MNQIPFEVIGAPLELWFAPVGTAFTLIDTIPTSPWTLLGTSGDLSYDEDGITIEHAQSVDPWRPLGDAGPRKYFRTEEDVKISVVIADMTLEQLKHALNENTVTTVPPGVGTAGYKKIGLSRGLTIATQALLCRATGYSPYGVFNLQYEFPRVVNTGSSAPNWKRSEPALLALEFMGLVDETAGSDDERFGRLIAQHADADT